MEINSSLASPRKDVSIVSGPVYHVSQSFGTKAEMFLCSFHLFLMANFSVKKAQFALGKVSVATFCWNSA